MPVEPVDARNRVFLLIVWLFSSGIIGDEGNSQTAETDHHLNQLRNSTDSSREEKSLRASSLKALHRSEFPDEVFLIFAEQLRKKNVAVVFDIAETEDLWSEDFAAPLLNIFLDDRRLQVREKVLESFSKHRGLLLQERYSLSVGLHDQGELDAVSTTPTPRFIELLTKIGDPSAKMFLSKFLQCTDMVPSGIGLSQPLPALPPRLRICDYAHDAIVKLCGGSLEARVAIAYQELEFTNRFDTRKLNFSHPTELASSQDNKEVVDESVINKQLYEEVRRVRDKMNDNLRSELMKAGLIEHSSVLK